MLEYPRFAPTGAKSSTGSAQQLANVNRDYEQRIRRYILFHGETYPRETDTEPVEALLRSPPVERRVSRDCIISPLYWLQGKDRNYRA